MHSAKWDGTYLGRGDDLVYAGKLDHGFDKVSTANLQKRLKPLIRKMQPYPKRISHKAFGSSRSCSPSSSIGQSRRRAKCGTIFKGLRVDH